jgi:hypothetical protein
MVVKIKKDEMRIMEREKYTEELETPIMERETYTEELHNLSSVSFLRWSGSEG